MKEVEREKILTAEEAAEYLRMALSTLYRYMRQGQMPCFKVGNQWRFKRSVLDQWMEKMSTINVGLKMETAMKTTKAKKPGEKGEVNVSFDLGLGGIFKGIGSLLELASELAEKAPTEVRREGEISPIGEKGFKAVYGFSVKVGSGGRPTVQQFGNVREEATGPVVDEVREPMVDTFDEGEFILVVAEMPGIDEADIKYELKKDILIIAGETKDRKYYKELLLPTSVDEEKSSHAIKNGIMEIKLWKAR